MIQLFFIGIILYVILYFLAKSNLVNGMTRALSLVNTVIIVILGVNMLVKTGLLRAIAGFISFLLIRLTELIGSVF